MVETQTGKRIKILRSDQGGEYRLGEFMDFYKQHGIVQQFRVPHTPQQNGVEEWKNKTLVDCARSMPQGKGLSNGLWAEAINTVVYLNSRSPTRCLGFKTPFEALFGFKPVVQEEKDDSNSDCHIPLILEENSEEDEEHEQKQEEEVTGNVINDDASLEKAEIDIVEVSPLPRRSGRKTRLSFRLKDYALMPKIVNIVEPANYEEASKSDAWRATMYEEIKSVNRNHTWDLVELPEGKTPIGCKWLYKTKINADGSIEKLKARLVAKGYSQ
eukprot:PITA_24381